MLLQFSEKKLKPFKKWKDSHNDWTIIDWKGDVHANDDVIVKTYNSICLRIWKLISQWAPTFSDSQKINAQFSSG